MSVARGEQVLLRCLLLHKVRQVLLDDVLDDAVILDRVPPGQFRLRYLPLLLVLKVAARRFELGHLVNGGEVTHDTFTAAKLRHHFNLIRFLLLG